MRNTHYKALKNYVHNTLKANPGELRELVIETAREAATKIARESVENMLNSKNFSHFLSNSVRNSICKLKSDKVYYNTNFEDWVKELVKENLKEILISSLNISVKSKNEI